MPDFITSVGHCWLIFNEVFARAFLQSCSVIRQAQPASGDRFIPEVGLLPFLVEFHEVPLSTFLQTVEVCIIIQLFGWFVGDFLFVCFVLADLVLES